MLVLSRGKGDSIMIGEQVEVTVLEVSGNTVKIGINAPEDVEILRSELYVTQQRLRQSGGSHKQIAMAQVPLKAVPGS